MSFLCHFYDDSIQLICGRCDASMSRLERPFISGVIPQNRPSSVTSSWWARRPCFCRAFSVNIFRVGAPHCVFRERHVAINWLPIECGIHERASAVERWTNAERTLNERWTNAIISWLIRFNQSSFFHNSTLIGTVGGGADVERDRHHWPGCQKINQTSVDMQITLRSGSATTSAIWQRCFSSTPTISKIIFLKNRLIN